MGKHFYPDGMARVVDGKKVVRIASSEHDAGWRYDYDENVDEDNQLWDGEEEEEVEGINPNIDAMAGSAEAKAKHPNLVSPNEGWGGKNPPVVDNTPTVEKNIPPAHNVKTTKEQGEN